MGKNRAIMTILYGVREKYKTESLFRLFGFKTLAKITIS